MADQNSQTLSGSSWLLLIVLGLLWGGSFFFAGIAVQHMPPMTLALARFTLAAATLHIVIAGRYNIYRILRDRWLAFLVLGLVNNAIPHTFIFMGQTQIGAGLASILNATTPIWTVLIAHVLTTDEKLTSRKVAGTLMGLIGVVILFSPHLVMKAGVPLWAMALPILAAISYGFAAIWSRRFRGVPPTVTAAGQLTASTLMMLPLALIHDQPWMLPLPPITAIAAVIALAVVCTALAYIIFFRLIAQAGATNASLVTLLVPPSAILLSTLFLGEKLGWEDWAGMLMIGIGLAILDGRLVAGIARRWLGTIASR